MIKTVKFTQVKFLNVIKAPQGKANEILQVLLNNTYHQEDEDDVSACGEDVVVVYRNILFSEQDIDKDILAMERKMVEKMLETNQVAGEWLMTRIQEKSVFHIPENDVKYNGRTVCVEIYPSIQAYVE